MPSLATKVLLILAAAAQPDSLTPPPHGREVSAPVSPTVQAPGKVKAPPSATKPLEPTSPKSPRAPGTPVMERPSIPSTPARKTAKVPARADATPTSIEVPEEEIVAGPSGKIRSRHRGPRKVATVERPEPQERKNPWSTDRYAAVVPPGLTLAALRNQMTRGAVTTGEPDAPSGDRDRPMQTAADIEKAREALRQETARLEALLKTTGNCGGGSAGMSNGEPLLPTTSVSAAELREAASEQIDSVSKAIKGMKPEQAAALVARLNRGLAAEILRRMKSSDAGAILGLLKPDLAAELATEIALRKPTYPREKKGNSR